MSHPRNSKITFYKIFRKRRYQFFGFLVHALLITANFREREVSQFAEGDEAISTDDEVVVETDRHDLAGLDQNAGQMEVGFGGSGITAGMVMRND